MESFQPLMQSDAVSYDSMPAPSISSKILQSVRMLPTISHRWSALHVLFHICSFFAHSALRSRNLKYIGSPLANAPGCACVIRAVKVLQLLVQRKLPVFISQGFGPFIF